MPYVDIHPIKGETSADRKKTVTGKPTGPVAVEGESLRQLTWLTAADIKVLTLGRVGKFATKAEHLTCAVGGIRPV